MEKCSVMPEERYVVNLHSWLVVKVSGKDRFNYLDSIVSFNLKKIDMEAFYPNMLLTQKGKIRSLFWMTEKNDAFILLCPSRMKQNLVEDLLKFNINVEVKLEDITNEMPPLWFVAGGTNGVENSQMLLPTGKFMFDEAPTGTIVDEVAFKTSLPSQGKVWVEFLQDQNPVEVGLKNIISLEKGCFLGQEPIARMVNRGRPRYHLFQVLLRLEDFMVKDNQTLLWQDKEIGQILQICNSDTPVSMALLKIRGDEEGIVNKLVNLKLAVQIGTY